MTIKAVYPGTFDPITNGHCDLVRRASTLFDEIIIGVCHTPPKNTFFSIEERLAFAKESLTSYKNVSVYAFDGLLINFAKQHAAKIILRGLRAVSDFEYEFQYASMNRRLDGTLESVFLTPDEKYSFISSSLIREIALLGGDVSQFVTPFVSAAIHKRFTQKENT